MNFPFLVNKMDMELSLVILFMTSLLYRASRCQLEIFLLFMGAAECGS